MCNGRQYFIATPLYLVNCKINKNMNPCCRIHVVFGQVLQGQEVVTEIESQRVDDKSRPLVNVKVSNCGELIPKAKAKGMSYFKCH